jgi:hypothetical protein
MIKKRTLYVAFFLYVILFVGLQFYLLSKARNHNSKAPFDLILINDSIIKPPIINFDVSKDWLVFFHIQKTSGSDFDHKLLENLLVFNKTEKRREYRWRKACNAFLKKSTIDEKNHHFRTYKCQRSKRSNTSWILSHSTEFGWHTCGLHADLDDLKACVVHNFQKSDGIFHYLTMLREPRSRFLSEWIHIKQTGSMWIFEMDAKTSNQLCSNNFFRKCTTANRTDWSRVTLSEFISCEYNLAFNRQARMLANYDKSFYLCGYLQNRNKNASLNDELFERAKRSLHSLSFFGLTEHQYQSMALFRRTFGDMFKFEKDVWNVKMNSGDRISNVLDKTTLKKIEEINSVDMKLYKYAVKLFFKRLEHYKLI